MGLNARFRNKLVPWNCRREAESVETVEGKGKKDRVVGLASGECREIEEEDSDGRKRRIDGIAVPDRGKGASFSCLCLLE